MSEKNQGARSGFLVAIALAVGMVLAVPVTTRAEYAGFFDVGRRDWYVTGGYLDYVLENGIMTGKDDGSFAPGEVVSRAQAVTVLWRVAGEPNAGAPVFPDCERDAFYAKAVAWANSEGVVTGYEDGTFGPEDPVTREQLATMIERYASKAAGIDTRSDGSALSDMADAGSVSPFAQAAMAWVVDEGILTGDVSSGQPLALPMGGAQRDQLAKMASVFHAEVLGRGEIVPNPAPTVGRYGSYLAKVRELEGAYGTGVVRTLSRGTWRAKWVEGLCFADLVDFGDGVERLVTVVEADDDTQEYPTLLEAYRVAVWDYDAQSDSVVMLWQGYSSYRYGTDFSLDFATSPDGSRTQLFKCTPITGFTFVGLRGDGSFGMLHTVDSSYDSSVGDFVNLVDGASVPIETYWDVLGSMGMSTPDSPGNQVSYALLSIDADINEFDPEVTLQVTRSTIAELERK